MLSATIYLTFNGNCEEAFNFYQSILGGELKDLTRFSEMPPQEDMPPTPTEMSNLLMHVELVINPETKIMGSDTGGEWDSGFMQGNNFSISLSADSKEVADQLCLGLASGGHITMPMSQTFWSAYFGMLTDRFGINWIISVDM